jgi:hypothetical protein
LPRTEPCPSRGIAAQNDAMKEKNVMRAPTRRKIWLGFGACVIAGTGTVGGAVIRGGAARDDGGHLPAAGALAQQGGHEREPDEGGETKQLAALPPALAFAARIALLRGHLLVGNELVTQQQWNAALPHFLHPGEEIYGDIKDQLGVYGAPQFEPDLKALADVVKARKGGKDYAKALQRVKDALAAADAGLKAKQDNWAGFVIEAAVETLKMAADEYQKAIVGGRIAKPVEYQDARGFIWQADAMIESVSAALASRDAGSLAGVRAGLAELKKAFPSAIPPKAPVKDAAAVLGDISRIELAAGKLM